MRRVRGRSCHAVVSRWCQRRTKDGTSAAFIESRRQGRRRWRGAPDRLHDRLTAHRRKLSLLSYEPSQSCVRIGQKVKSDQNCPLGRSRVQSPDLFHVASGLPWRAQSQALAGSIAAISHWFCVLASLESAPSHPVMYESINSQISIFGCALRAMSSCRGRGPRERILKTRATRNPGSANGLCGSSLDTPHHPPRARIAVKTRRQFRVLPGGSTGMCMQPKGRRTYRNTKLRVEESQERRPPTHQHAA